VESKSYRVRNKRRNVKRASALNASQLRMLLLLFFVPLIFSLTPIDFNQALEQSVLTIEETLFPNNDEASLALRKQLQEFKSKLIKKMAQDPTVDATKILEKQTEKWKKKKLRHWLLGIKSVWKGIEDKVIRRIKKLCSFECQKSGWTQDEDELLSETCKFIGDVVNQEFVKAITR
jgi:hypothetical protein